MFKPMKTNKIAPTMEQLIVAYQKADDERKAQAFNTLTGADVNQTKDTLHTKKEACETLHCSPATLDRLVKAGKLTKIQTFGKHSKNLFKLSELQALIETSKTILNPTAQEATV